MGKIIGISTKKIKPSQDFLKEGTVDFILDCIAENKKDKLPPAPIVRENPDSLGEYIAIDGHNLLAVKDFLKEEVDVYVAESGGDFIDGNSEAIAIRNQELKDKFDFVLNESHRIEKEGVSGFSDLCKKYPFFKIHD